MIRSVWLEESLTRAFELAYFIHGDKGVALRIATEALAKLEVAAAAQDKRLYYRPVGRASHANGDRFRNKVSVGERLLLQRMVYVESEPHERQGEEASIPSPDGEDMVIRYIKYLAQITTKRNSFHVTLGLSRLLYNYSTTETMELHRVVAQDAERVREDSYYRARKGQLMKELKERFGDRLTVIRGPHGEERFQTEDCNHVDLARECLRMFTPWDTGCEIPARFDPFVEELSTLSFNGADPDEEHKIEVKRFHAALHPDCFERLTASLNFAPPCKRLAAPSFFMSEKDDDNLNQGRRPHWRSRRSPRLDEAELKAVELLLDERSARRKRAVAGLMRILVNGRERARLDLSRASRARFEVGEGDELIEVRVAEGDGDLLLAAHLLRHDSSNAPPPGQTSITLEGGQKISFTVAPVKDSRDQSSGATIDLSYRETRLRRAAALLLRRVACALADAWRASGFAMKPSLAFGLLAIFALLVMLNWRAGEGWKRFQTVRQQTPTPAIVAPASPQSPVAPTQNKRRETNAPGGARKPASDEPPLIVQEDKPGQPRPEERDLQTVRQQTPTPAVPAEPPPSPPLPGETVTPSPPSPAHTVTPSPPAQARLDVVPDPAPRNPKTNTEGARVAAVKKVYVDPFGDEPAAQQFRDLLIARLRSDSRLTIVANRDEADAALKVKLITVRGDQVLILVRLINIRGDGVWPHIDPIPGKLYQGATAIVAKQVAQDILADI
jgi:hypothetical protein